MEDASILSEVEELFKGKVFLSVDDIAVLLGCDPQIVHNWTKRPDPRKRPPRILVGKELRFPRRDFVRWLLAEQLSIGG